MEKLTESIRMQKTEWEMPTECDAHWYRQSDRQRDGWTWKYNPVDPPNTLFWDEKHYLSVIKWVMEY